MYYHSLTVYKLILMLILILMDMCLHICMGRVRRKGQVMGIMLIDLCSSCMILGRKLGILFIRRNILGMANWISKPRNIRIRRIVGIIKMLRITKEKVRNKLLPIPNYTTVVSLIPIIRKQQSRVIKTKRMIKVWNILFIRRSKIMGLVCIMKKHS